MRPADGTVAARLDFLIVGAQKCAITWLYDCLAEHPELALPKHKLEDAHLGGDLHRLHADEWLFDHFHSTPDNRIRGHVSVEHPAEARSPAEVHRLLPDVRLIVSLRDPEDRAVSAFHWYVRKGKRPPMALDIALDAALHALEDDDPAHAPLRDLLERGFYARQLDRYPRHFPIERFPFLDYDDIAERPAQVLAQTFSFLSVSPAFRPPSFGSRPKRNSHVAWLTRLQRLTPTSRAAGRAFDLAHQALYRMGARPNRPTLERALDGRLQALYAPHDDRMRALLQRAPASQRPAGGSWLTEPQGR